LSMLISLLAITARVALMMSARFGLRLTLIVIFLRMEYRIISDCWSMFNVLRIRIGCGVAALLAEWNAHPRANPIKYATMVVYSFILFITDKKECGGKNNFFAANTDFSPN
ncbi:MAG: hypothetical protein J7L07_03225, partial [Candidatus Odinarchaeota archaeon]|nr:hypothetical protein [Candidatus Odinarchaeota archaeon]